MTYAQPHADPTNVVGRRIGAYVIDTFIMVALIFAVVYPLFMSASVEEPSNRATCPSLSEDSEFTSELDLDASICVELGDTVRYVPVGEENAFVAQFYGVALGIPLLNLVLLQGLTGASLGKLILGLRVVRQDGSTAGLGWAALRWLLLLIDGACCAIIGLVLVFTTKGHRRLGDMAASTFVVTKRDVGTPPQVPGVTSPAATPSGAPAYGAAPAAGAWGAEPQGQASSSASNAEGPTWDAARNAYIQYDPAQGAWVQWNDTTQTWGPIDQ